MERLGGGLRKMTRPLCLYLIAGELSGDQLGAGLMKALRIEVPQIRFVGVGGRRMAAEGLESLFDIADLNVMGIAEVVPRLGLLMRRIRTTADDVLRVAPDALITIDSPSFGLRVAERVRGKAPNIRTIHHVAPSVWAWRPGRARQMAGYIDHVLALLPFEPPYMTAFNMTCDFVGHPVAGQPVASAVEIAAFRANAGISADQRLLLLAPGSRRSEVSHLMPTFAGTLARVTERHPGLRVVIPVAETVVPEITAAVTKLAHRPVLMLPDVSEEAKRAAFAAADCALLASGTVTLETAAAGTPMVSAYRTSWLTAAIARRLLRVDTANLVNLVDGEKVVPEFLQNDCRDDLIAPAVSDLLENPAARAAQVAAFTRVMTTLGRGGELPSVRAARSVLRTLG
jgi:lipid-A-disaccharide synthase